MAIGYCGEHYAWWEPHVPNLIQEHNLEMQVEMHKNMDALQKLDKWDQAQKDLKNGKIQPNQLPPQPSQKDINRALKLMSKTRDVIFSVIDQCNNPCDDEEYSIYLKESYEKVEKWRNNPDNAQKPTALDYEFWWEYLTKETVNA